MFINRSRRCPLHCDIPSPSESIAAYINAKDSNRPHLLDTAFTADASLRMHVLTDAISFPPALVGREAIADTLVRRFNQTYENIYTLCIGEPPEADAQIYSCDWFVAMSEKQSGAVRVGCGRYDWSFTANHNQVQSLEIRIVAMENFPAETLRSVMNVVTAMPYPWCGRQLAERALAGSTTLRRVLEFLRRNGAD